MFGLLGLNKYVIGAALLGTVAAFVYGVKVGYGWREGVHLREIAAIQKKFDENLSKLQKKLDAAGLAHLDAETENEKLAELFRNTPVIVDCSVDDNGLHNTLAKLR